MKMKCLMFLSFGLLLSGISAYAHGPQMQITADSGKIVTREIIPDGPYSDSLTNFKSVYVMPLKEYLGVWYTRPNGEINLGTGLPAYYSGPGIAYGYGYSAENPTATGFEVGTTISLQFAAGLSLWDGSDFVDAGSTEMEVFRGNFVSPSSTAKTTDAGPYESVAYNPVSFGSGAEVHATTRFRLLGDGDSPESDSPDGVYLLTMRFTTTQADLDDSDPFYFVLGKRASISDIQLAVSSLGVDPSLVQYVPEPSGLVLFASLIGGMLTLGHRGRKWTC